MVNIENTINGIKHDSHEMTWLYNFIGIKKKIIK